MSLASSVLTAMINGSNTCDQKENNKKVKHLLKNNVDVNQVDSFGITTLIHAIKQKNLEVIKWLVEKNADLETTDIDGKTPLLLSMSYYNSYKEQNDSAENNYNAQRNSQVERDHVVFEKIYKYLVKSGASVNCVDYDGNTPLSMAKGNLDTIKFLLDHGADINRVVENQTTLLTSAAQAGNLMLIKDLLALGAKINLVDGTGHTALAQAVASLTAQASSPVSTQVSRSFAAQTSGPVSTEAFASPSVDLITFLVESGADPCKKGINGQTPLEILVTIQDSHIQTRTLDYLIDNGAIYTINSALFTSFVYGLKYEETQSLSEYFLLKGADVNYIHDTGYTALTFLVAHHDDPEKWFLLTNLLNIDKVNVDIIDNRGFTPLTSCISSSSISKLDIIQTLLRKSAQVEKLDKNGALPLPLACEQNDFGIVKILVASADVNKPDGKGETPLEKALKNSNLEIAKYLLKHNADPSLISQVKKTTLLNKFIKIGNLENVKFMIEEIGVDVTQPDENGRYPIIEAIENTNGNIVDFLIGPKNPHVIRSTANLNVKSIDGKSVLAIAAANGDFMLVVKLIERGVALDAAKEELEAFAKWNQDFSVYYNKIKNNKQ